MLHSVSGHFPKGEKADYNQNDHCQSLESKLWLFSPWEFLVIWWSNIQILVFIVICLSSNSVVVHRREIPVVEACASKFVTGNYWPGVAQLANVFFKLHSWSEDTPINIYGIASHVNVKGKISKWKWDGRLRCYSIASGIVEHDTKLSWNGAIEWSIQDFLHKASFSRSTSTETISILTSPTDVAPSLTNHFQKNKKIFSNENQWKVSINWSFQKRNSNEWSGITRREDVDIWCSIQSSISSQKFPLNIHHHHLICVH